MQRETVVGVTRALIPDEKQAYPVVAGGATVFQTPMVEFTLISHPHEKHADLEARYLLALFVRGGKDRELPHTKVDVPLARLFGRLGRREYEVEQMSLGARALKEGTSAVYLYDWAQKVFESKNPLAEVLELEDGPALQSGQQSVYRMYLKYVQTVAQTLLRAEARARRPAHSVREHGHG